MFLNWSHFEQMSVENHIYYIYIYLSTYIIVYIYIYISDMRIFKIIEELAFASARARGCWAYCCCVFFLCDLLQKTLLFHSHAVQPKMLDICSVFIFWCSGKTNNTDIRTQCFEQIKAQHTVITSKFKPCWFQREKHQKYKRHWYLQDCRTNGKMLRICFSLRASSTPLPSG